MKTARVVRFVLAIAVICALIAGLVVLYAKTSSVDAEKKTEVEGYLKQLKQLDAEWNVDVLKSRMELNKHYDPLTGPLPSLIALQERLSAETLAVKQPGTEKALNELKAVIAEKIDLVDQFKAQNSILKNSLRYVPTAVDELRTFIRESTRTAPANRQALDLLDARANQILNDVLKYNLLGDLEIAGRIEAELAEIESAESIYPAAIAGSVRNLAAHARTILRQRRIESDVVTRISAMPMTQAIDQLNEVFDRDFQASLSEIERYRDYLLAYSSLLLALLVYIGGRLFRSYRIIARVNRELKNANETLEQRVRDRTEELSDALKHLKESEAQLVQSEKMASLGQMVAGVAHEINTPLAYVRSSLETVESQVSTHLREFLDSVVSLIAAMRSEDGGSDEEIAEKFAAASAIADNFAEYGIADEVQGLLKNAVHGVDEISKIVLNLKNFSRLDRSHVESCTIDECLENTLELAKTVLKGKSVRKVFASTSPLRCAPSQINQVLLNLLTNAAQATDQDGRITIVTRMQGADRIAVDVIDNGVGIPSDVLPKIFDPFFTTKPIGKGTGLGLSIAYKIIEQHGGQIRVHSREGVGTKFTIVLPVQQTAAGLSRPADRISEDVLMVAA